MFHMRYYSHATKACSTSQIRRLRIAIAKATTFQARQPGFHDLWGHLRAPARFDLIQITTETFCNLGTGR